ncbi:MAG: MBL fold metallo-hydrolase [Planctomycetia bacterium]|nr:MBL fold metallo-hydrolase [Planctomycetia bacterium]
MTERLPLGDLLFLGTGTSHGIPVIGCSCEVCTSTDPRNTRTRSSIILGLPEGNLLIDTPTDLWSQFNREKLRYANAILYTHAHSDHLMGLDDVRIFSRHLEGQSILVYCEACVEKDIRKKFDYIFDAKVQLFYKNVLPKLLIQEIIPYKPFFALGAKVLPLRFHHGITDVLGFRFGNVAYCTDIKEIPPETLTHLYNLDILIIDCLGYKPHITHLNVTEVLKLVEELKPKKTFLTHISHDLEHDSFTKTSPANVIPAYDGLRLTDCKFLS